MLVTVPVRIRGWKLDSWYWSDMLLNCPSSSVVLVISSPTKINWKINYIKQIIIKDKTYKLNWAQQFQTTVWGEIDFSVENNQSAAV